ncbi:hypothetical protein [Streptomyces sp. 3N207]|uniref:hypothetical protein n=1 Tax=Streptomyces sp. 3N207 TaxID=3457417 RepID=UPI003FD6A385
MGNGFGGNSTGTSERPALSRRRILGMSGVAGLAVLGAAACSDDSGSGKSKDAESGKQGKGSEESKKAKEGSRVTPPPPVGILGANFNGDPAKVTFDELEGVSATWLRGFFPMRDADKGAISEKPQIKKLLEAKERGYGTVLSLKFPYNEQDIPTPGTDAWKTAFERVKKVLPTIMDRVDILVIGNEPFLETRKNQRDRRLNLFYEKIAQYIIAYRAEHSARKTKLYMGALNHLDWANGQTGATKRWMKFVKKTKDIEGVDIHPHVTSLAGAKKYLDYILPRMRPEQKFLATEFSLVLLWKQHQTDPVSAQFAKKYKDAQGKQVWEVLREATEHRFTQQKWDDFLSMTPWFEDNKTYLQDQLEQFRKTERLAVATYGVSQDEAMTTNFTAKKNPWMLNSLYCPYTVRQGKGGLPGRNRVWIDQFRALQKTD